MAQAPRPRRGKRAVDGIAPERGISPRIGVEMGDPAGAVIRHPRRVLARLRDHADEIEERLLELRQTADLGEPVVHLNVDVDVEICAPRGGVLPAPDPLEI